MTVRLRPRPGFTLVELLIVIGIIVLIAGLAVLFLPNLDKDKGVPNAVTQVQGWLNVGKQQAIRDHRPYGLRLIHDGNGLCSTLLYIEQPEPVVPRGLGIKIDLRVMDVWDPVLFPGNPGNIGRTTVVTLFQDPTNQWPPVSPIPPPESNATPPINWVNWDGVQPGDYFELSGTINAIATIRRFTWGYPPNPPTPGPTPPANPTGPNKYAQLVLDRVIEGLEDPPPGILPPPAPRGIAMSNGFRVIRAPRPLAGEPLLQMHKDVAIDLTACFPCPLNIDWPAPGQYQQHPSGLQYAFQNPNPLPAYYTFYANWGTQPIPLTERLPQPVPVDVNYVDILFNSSGFVANAPVGRYVICVRHRERPTDVHFVTIYTRTGKITNHAVNDGIGTPYLFTQDGSAPGL